MRESIGGGRRKALGKTQDRLHPPDTRISYGKEWGRCLGLFLSSRGAPGNKIILSVAGPTSVRGQVPEHARAAHPDTNRPGRSGAPSGRAPVGRTAGENPPGRPDGAQVPGPGDTDRP